MRNLLIPAIFVGVSIAPGCQWARPCQVVPLASLLSENRASRVSITIVADVAFPEVVSFPCQQRLTLNGAFEDSTLPAPRPNDEKGEWGVIIDTGVEDEDLLQFKGICSENSPQVQRMKMIKIMMAIDPDTAPYEAEPSEDERTELDEIGGVPDWYLDTVDPLEPDVAEAGNAGAQPTPVEAAELVTSGRAPPAWRRDDFPATGPVRRSVWAPPYSLRPPDREPEEWVSLNQKTKNELRERWKLRDSEGFAALELRRKHYFEMKRKGQIPKASVALPVLQCKMFFLIQRTKCFMMMGILAIQHLLVRSIMVSSSGFLALLRWPLQLVNRKGSLSQATPPLNSNSMLYVCWKARRRCSVRHSEGSMLCS